MRTRRFPLGLIVPLALVALVATLATLQYRWLGQVSDAERDRMRTSLKENARDFADAFDRELLHLYVAFQAEATAVGRRDWDSVARRYDTWASTAAHPQILRGLYLVESSEDPSTLLEFKPAQRTFEPVAWPADLADVRRRLSDAAYRHAADAIGADHARTIITLREPVVASVPALIIALPRFEPFDLKSARVAVRFGSASLIAQLERTYLQSTLLPSLAARYFPERGANSYRFAVVSATDPAERVFSRDVADNVTLDPKAADAVVPLFSIRGDLMGHVMTRTFAKTAPPSGVLGIAPPMPLPAPGAARGRPDMFSIVVDRRAGPEAADVKTFMRAAGAPSWQLVLQHQAGSLDAAVNQARMRNLWLSFGILAVLMVGMGLVVLNARRSERLAAQQMDFVATVSHELRTPLAVIRSAAQNLSAGVVSESEHARRYGDLIEQEGRRLTDMVEQVLEYSGLSGNPRPVLVRPVDVGTLIKDVLTGFSASTDAGQFATTVEISPELPLIEIDDNAVRRAVTNLISNALKHGADGRWLGVAIRHVPPGEIQISISDRGRGIAPEDLPHIFEPFYRGRHALDRQIQGNGLGLSLVRRIAEAHGGRVSVASVPGESTTLTLHLPVGQAASRAEALSPGASETTSASLSTTPSA